MKEIILEKRYPHSREEDITDAFMRGYEIGKEQEHRWWSTFCANCKTENSSEKPNNCEDEPQYEMGMGTLKCDNCSEYGSFKCTKCDGEMYFKRLEPRDEPQTDCSWK